MDNFLFESHLTKIKPQFLFGLDTDVKHNVHFVDENVLVYPVGRQFVYHNLSKNSQHFMRIPSNHKKVNAVAVAPNKKVIAIAEIGIRPSVSVYNLATKNRIKLLGIPFENSKAKEFYDVSFTWDSNKLVALAGDPDWMILYYDWRKGKLENFMRVLRGRPGSLTCLGCNPTDRTVVAVGGPGVFHLMTNSEKQWVKYGFQKAKRLPITSLCWLNSDVVIAGTSDGRLAVIKYAELKGVFNVDETTEILIEEKKGAEKVELLVPLAPKRLRSGTYVIKSLVCFAYGFAFSYFPGTVTIFQLVGNNHWVKKVSFYCPSPPIKDFEDKNLANSVSVHPSCTKLICTFGTPQIFIAEDIQAEYLYLKSLNRPLSVLLNGYHQGPVTTVATCAWKPLFLSIGALDKTCRIWDYNTKSQVLSKEFPEMMCSADFHPSAAFVLISFTRKVDLMMVLIDDITTVWTWEIRNSPLVRFSKGGHLFVALDNLQLNVYSVVNFERIRVFESDKAPIISHVCFTNEDNYLCACSHNEYVCKWSLKTGELLEEVQIPRNGNTALESCRSGDHVFVVGTDGKLKDIFANKIKYDLNLKLYSLNTLSLDATETVLFLGGENGTVVSVSHPLTNPPVYREFFMHNAPLKKLVTTPISNVLISLDEIGVIALWTIKTKAQLPFHVPDISPLKLMNVQDWEDDSTRITEQTLRIEEMANEHSYILLHSNRSHEMKKAEISETFQNTISDLKSLIEQSKVRNLIEMNSYEVKLEEKTNQFISEIEEQAWEYEKLIKVEGIKNGDLADQITKLKKECEEILGTAKRTVEEVLKEHDVFCSAAVNGIKKENKDLQKMLQKIHDKHLVEVDHIHMEFDAEIQDLEQELSNTVSALENAKKNIAKDNAFLKEKIKALKNDYNGAVSFYREIFKKLKEFGDKASKLGNSIESKRFEIEEKACGMKRKNELTLEVVKQNECFADEVVVDMCIDDLKFEARLEPMMVEHTKRKKTEEELRNDLDSLNRTIARLALYLTHRRVSLPERRGCEPQFLRSEYPKITHDFTRKYSCSADKFFRKKDRKKRGIKKRSVAIPSPSNVTYTLNSAIYCYHDKIMKRDQLRQATGYNPKSEDDVWKLKQNYNANLHKWTLKRKQFKLKQKEYKEIIQILVDQLSDLMLKKLIYLHKEESYTQKNSLAK